MPLTPAPAPPRLSASLAGIQPAKVEEEIDSKRDSHVMWRGTKEDPRGLGGLRATCSIPQTTVSTVALGHHPKNNTVPAPYCSPRLCQFCGCFKTLMSVRQHLKPWATVWKCSRSKDSFGPSQKKSHRQLYPQAFIEGWEMSYHCSRILPLHYFQVFSGQSIFLGP